MLSWLISLCCFFSCSNGVLYRRSGGRVQLRSGELTQEASAEGWVTAPGSQRVSDVLAPPIGAGMRAFRCSSDSARASVVAAPLAEPKSPILAIVPFQSGQLAAHEPAVEAVDPKQARTKSWRKIDELEFRGKALRVPARDLLQEKELANKVAPFTGSSFAKQKSILRYS